MKNNKSGFTLIELVIGMTMSAIVMTMIGNFGFEYYKSSIEIKKIQNEFSDLNLGLNSLQKIIFENAKFITINSEATTGGQCSGFTTDKVGLGSLCHSKFSFTIENEAFQEEEYFVELVDCNLGNITGKQLIYKKGSEVIPLLGSCIYNETNTSIEHKISIINDNIKEKIFRYTIITGNGKYIQTFFVN